MAVKLQLRRDTTANWAASNPILAAGEIGIDTTLRQAKIGDGTTAWSSLGYGLANVETVGVTDGDKGDIVVSSLGTVWTVDAAAIGTTKIADDAVTNAKMANMAASTMKGRVTGSTGDPEDLTVTQVRTILSLRETLSANRTYYVRTDGSDSNNGLTNSAGGAFLTIQKAVDTALSVDNIGYDITISIQSGTYTGAVVVDSPLFNAGHLFFAGSSATVSTTNATCFTILGGARVTFSGLTLQTTTSGNCIQALGNSQFTLGANMVFGACAGTAHMVAQSFSYGSVDVDYSITGSAARHFYVDGGSIYCGSSRTITLTGTPGFVNGFAVVTGLGSIVTFGNTYSGAATGPRYNATLNSVINTFGGGASYFPGNSAGSTATGGLYA